MRDFHSSAVTEEFRMLARELGDLYHRRKDLAKDIIFKEDRLRHLGLFLEYADNLEETLDEER